MILDPGLPWNSCVFRAVQRKKWDVTGFGSYLAVVGTLTGSLYKS